MAKTLEVGITGGIGAGKSLVTRIFHALGVPVYDADTNAKKVMNSDPVLVAKIKKEFGDEAYLPDGTINRTYLSSVVFSSKEKVEKLNGFVHPRVARDYENWVKQHVSSPYVLKEAALLYETGSFSGMDKMIVVTAPEALRIKRVRERDPQRTEDEIRKIISNQLPEEEKASRADYVIVNDEKKPLIVEILRLHFQFNRG